MFAEVVFAVENNEGLDVFPALSKLLTIHALDIKALDKLVDISVCERLASLRGGTRLG